MTQTVEAIYDGVCLRPLAEVHLEPNTRVRLTFEVVASNEKTRVSFLQTARTLNLVGPSDWSTNLDNYLYGDGNQPRD